MTDGVISVPTWALPIGAALVSFAVGYGAITAQADATANELSRLQTVAEDTAEKAVKNGELSSVNEAKIEAIVSSLAEQKEIQRMTNENISQLVEVMLSRK